MASFGIKYDFEQMEGENFPNLGRSSRKRDVLGECYNGNSSEIVWVHRNKVYCIYK